MSPPIPLTLPMSVHPETSAAFVVTFTWAAPGRSETMQPGAHGRHCREERCSDKEIHGHPDSGQLGCDFGGVISGGGVSKNPAVGMGVNSGGLGSGVEHPVEDNAVSTRQWANKD